MLKRKENTINYLGTSLFIVLFFLFIAVFSDSSVNKTTAESYHHELITVTKSSSVNAVIVDVVKVPTFQKSWVIAVDKLNFNLYDEHLRVLSDNSKIVLQTILLQQTLLNIKPEVSYRFYYHLFSENSDELPVLS